MPLSPSPPLPSSTVRPTVSEVVAYAEEQIRQAAAELWPREPVELAEHVPSVTAYVRRVRLGERLLYAKVSILGVSLVSLLRGTRGDWPTVVRKEQAYVTDSGCLASREAAQLRFLTTLDRPRVSPLAGAWRGVLFTEPATGPTLMDMLLARPQSTADLLTRAVEVLRPLRDPATARTLGTSRMVPERSIAGTFRRKFNPGTANLPQLVAERCAADAYEEVVASLSRSVARLHQQPSQLGPAPATLAYGDFKPEHIIYRNGQSGAVLLDPGLLRAHPTMDTAKLLSRTVLAVTAKQRPPNATQDLLAGIDWFAERRTRRLTRAARAVWLREVLTLWLMDTTNIATTYLSAPPELPLPGQALALVDRAVAVCRMVDEASASMASDATPQDAWTRLLECAHRACT